MPAFLNAVGQSHRALKFQNLSPLSDINSIKIACRELSELSCGNYDILEDLYYWVETAAWAAIKNDPDRFKFSIDSAHSIIYDELLKINNQKTN